MRIGLPLEEYMSAGTGQDGPTARAVAETALAIADAGRGLADLLAAGPFVPTLAAHRGAAHGDTQTELDLRVDALLFDVLHSCPVACVASEERDTAEALRPCAPLAVAMDPLDGSSNIDTNAPVGTIFSILRARPGEPAASFLRPGAEQLAAGFLIYGPQTSLVITLGDGTHVFTLDRERGGFVASAVAIHIPAAAREYAINGSNQRHWEPPVRRYVRECQLGSDGPRGRDFNTRWIASMVAEAYRILVRGGVYLYPSDARAGYRSGRLRLVYEANPIAWLIEQAGGVATDGERRILDLLPESIHQRVPLVFGAAEDVGLIASYHAAPDGNHAEPLFASRSLFRDTADLRGACA